MKHQPVLRACCLAACLSLAGNVCGERNAAEPQWKVGLASVKITPERPVPMAGYASRKKLFEQVEADIFAKALALEDAEGNRAVLVTSDLIGFRAAVAERIYASANEKTGLKREQILLNSSHSHSGPALAATPNSEDAESLRTVEYTRKLQDQVVDVIARALADLKPAQLSAGGGVVNFPMNRREFRPTGVVLGVNARGPVDRSVPVLRIDSDGQLRGVLFGAGSHNTTLTGNNYRLCGDYAGFAQHDIEGKLPGVTALFMLGCAGDANPYPRGTMDLARQHGASLAGEVCRVLDTKLRPIHGPLRIAFGQAALPLEPVPPRDELERRAAGKTRYHPSGAQGMLALLDKGETPPSEYTCPFTVWQLGDDLTLVALSGEVVIDYLPMLEKALGPNQLWVTAYSNDVFGYLPSARVLEEGGYETRGLSWGGAGYFAPTAQDVVVAKVRQLAEQAGRKLPAGNRWEKEIQAFERQDAKQQPPEDAVLFVGSSSIRLWKLDESFPDLNIINRGFGGSQLADAAHFADRIVIPYRPRLVVLYAGDNDLAAGKKPEQVLADFKQFAAKVKAGLPETRIAFLSIKPSIQRRALIDRIRETNAAIQRFISGEERLSYVDIFQPMLTADGQPRPELFRADGLHLNAEGYKLWASVVQPTLTRAGRER